MSADRHGQPLIAVDVVPLRFGQALEAGVAVRANEPFAGRPALPGVLLLPGERLADAAYRALADKAGIHRAGVRCLVQIGTFDGPSRDPRETAVSVSYVAVVGPDDEGACQWVSASQATGLPFDHDQIVAAALEHCRLLLWSDAALARALTGEEFTTSAASDLVETLTGSRPDHGNLNRMLRTDSRLSRTGSRPDGPGRPATLWQWVG